MSQLAVCIAPLLKRRIAIPLVFELIEIDVRLDEVFAVQDEITATVAGKLAVQLDDAELARVRRASLGELEAYDCWLRGSDCLRRGTLEADEELVGDVAERARRRVR